MVAGDHHGPLVSGQPPLAGGHVPAGVQVLFGLAAPVGEDPGIAGVDQDVVHGRVVGLRPRDLPGADVPAGQPQAVGAEADHHLPGRAELAEAAEHARDRFADRLIRGDDHVVTVVVVQPGGQRQPQLAAGSLGPQSLGHPCPQQVQFCLREGPFETQHEAVVIAGGMVDAVGVGDQRIGQRAQIQEPVPVGVVAGQP